MKKIALFLVVGLITLLLFSTAAAQPASYDSGFQVQNLSATDDANVVITYYNKDGSVDTTVSATIAADSSTTFFPIGASVGFDGSVVISSDQEIAAITNVLGDGFDFGASYGGFSAGAASVNLPLIMKDNYDYSTWFNVQNAGSADTTVTVTYGGTSCTETATIEPGAAATFDQATNSCLASGFVGAATVTADSGGSIVATVIETGVSTLYAYNGFTGSSTEPVMPLVQANNVGYQTGVQIQNTGSSSTSVTVSYTPAGTGTACTETQTIAAGESETFALYAMSLPGSTSTTCTFGQHFIGSGEVTGNTTDQGLVAIVNQTDFIDKGSAYNAFDPASATTTLVMPLIMDDNYDYFTGFNVQNSDTSTIDLTCTFSNSSQTVTATLDPGEALNHLQLGVLPAGYVGSATCTADGNILGVVNELNLVSGGDSLFSYEAFNQ